MTMMELYTLNYIRYYNSPLSRVGYFHGLAVRCCHDACSCWGCLKTHLVTEHEGFEDKCLWRLPTEGRFQVSSYTCKKPSKARSRVWFRESRGWMLHKCKGRRHPFQPRPLWVGTPTRRALQNLALDKAVALESEEEHVECMRAYRHRLSKYGSAITWSPKVNISVCISLKSKILTEQGQGQGPTVLFATQWKRFRTRVPKQHSAAAPTKKLAGKTGITIEQ